MDDFKPDNACDVLSENTAASEAALNCRQRSSVNDSFDFEFQSRLHECETNIAGGILYPFADGRYAFVYRLFCCPKRRLQLNDRLNGICFFGEVSPRQERAKRNETPPEMGAGTAFRQNGKNSHGRDSGDVAYRNEQGNCIDSFQSNRRTSPISL